MLILFVIDSLTEYTGKGSYIRTDLGSKPSETVILCPFVFEESSPLLIQPLQLFHSIYTLFMNNRQYVLELTVNPKSVRQLFHCGYHLTSEEQK